MRNTIGVAIIIGRDNFFFQQTVQRKTIRLSLHIGVVIDEYAASLVTDDQEEFDNVL